MYPRSQRHGLLSVCQLLTNWGILLPADVQIDESLPPLMQCGGGIGLLPCGKKLHVSKSVSK